MRGENIPPAYFGKRAKIANGTQVIGENGIVEERNNCLRELNKNGDRNLAKPVGDFAIDGNRELEKERQTGNDICADQLGNPQYGLRGRPGWFSKGVGEF